MAKADDATSTIDWIWLRDDLALAVAALRVGGAGKRAADGMDGDRGTAVGLQIMEAARWGGPSKVGGKTPGKRRMGALPRFHGRSTKRFGQNALYYVSMRFRIAAQPFFLLIAQRGDGGREVRSPKVWRSATDAA